VRHSANIINKKLFMGIFDSVLVKYGALMVGYGVVGLPVFGPGREEYLKAINGDASLITRDYVRNSSLLINLAKAIGRLVISYKEIQQLAGYTTLVHEMKEVLDDLNEGRFMRTQVVGDSKEKDRREISNLNQMNKGSIVETDSAIAFDNVPIVSPNGDVLCESLNFKIEHGMNCIITGPNGCGKSSLFRILSGLWPLADGTLYRPSMEQLFYIPQRPYLPCGSLRDQIIYPHSTLQMQRNRVKDSDLLELLEWVKLSYLVEREGGWDVTNDWNDVLSGGEKQRIAMARLFYHKPLFAILDECTSAVSVDVEAILYNTAKRRGITLFTVSHRSTLFKFHDYILKFDGDGHYSFDRLVHS
jgi:ATP-binding cassette, subfamily D (ALD), member 3